MPPHLVALSEGPDIPLGRPIVLIGRHQECDIQIPSRKISRRHCCIAQVADYLVVRDLGSTNGILVNGTKVNEAQLRVGDELTIGNFKFKLAWPSDTGIKPQNPLPPVEAPELLSAEMPVAISEHRLQGKAPRALPVNPPPRPNVDDSHFSVSLPEPRNLIPLDSSHDHRVS